MTSTRSYWQRRSDSERAYDVVIAGAGITGASTAYWLRRLEPDARVAVVDRGEIAAGASGRNAGFLLRGTAENFARAVRTYGSDLAWDAFRFTTDSIAGLLEVLDHPECGVDVSGSLIAAGDADEDGEIRESVELLAARGEPTVYWPARVVEGRLGSEGFHGALFDPRNGSLDPVRTVRSLLLRSDAQIYARHAVLDFEPHESGFRVYVSHGEFRAQSVVLAMNAYLPQLLPELEEVIRPVRAQMAAFRTGRPFNLPLPVYSHEGYYYARSVDEKTLLVGGARHLHRDGEVGYGDAVTDALQRDLHAYTLAHFPRAEVVTADDAWSGVMGFTADGLPLLGQTADGVLWAGGYTGHGMAFAFGVGRLLARQALGLPLDEDEARLFKTELRPKVLPASA